VCFPGSPFHATSSTFHVRGTTSGGEDSEENDGEDRGENSTPT